MAFIAALLISVTPSYKIDLSFAFIGIQHRSVCVSDSGWLCYCTPLVTWADKKQTQIRCP